MSRHPSIQRIFLLLVLIMTVVCTLVGCSSSTPTEEHLIMRIKPFVSNENNKTYNTYQIIYYETKDDNTIHISDHYDDVLTGYDTEIHFKRKYGWTKSMAREAIDDVYGSIADLDFVTISVKQKKRVICALIKMDDLDNPDNMQKLVDAGFFELSGGETKVEGRVTVGFLASSLGAGGTVVELSDAKAADIPLHFNVSE